MVLALRLGAFLAAIAILEIAVATNWISAFVVPRPSSVLAGFPDLFVREYLFLRFLVTFGETFAAAAIAVAAGVPLGFLLYRHPKLDTAFRSWIGALAAAPLIMLYPLFLVVFGKNSGTVAAIGCIAALPPIIMKSVDGLKGARKVLTDVGRGFNAPPATIFWKIQLPAATPSIFNGVRLGLVLALVNVVAIEYLIYFGGLGQLVGKMADRFNVPGLYSAILLIIAISALFYALTEKVERWLRPF